MLASRCLPFGHSLFPITLHWQELIDKEPNRRLARFPKTIWCNINPAHSRAIPTMISRSGYRNPNPLLNPPCPPPDLDYKVNIYYIDSQVFRQNILWIGSLPRFPPLWNIAPSRSWIVRRGGKAEVERRANPGSKTVVLDYGGGGD